MRVFRTNEIQSKSCSPQSIDVDGKAASERLSSMVNPIPYHNPLDPLPAELHTRTIHPNGDTDSLSDDEIDPIDWAEVVFLLTDDIHTAGFCTSLGKFDVLCGRTTRQIAGHEGNRIFRDLVARYAFQYRHKRSHREKKEIADWIVNIVELNGGRFVQKKILLANRAGMEDYTEQRPLREGEIVVYAPASPSVVNEKVRHALRKHDPTVTHADLMYLPCGVVSQMHWRGSHA